MDHDEYVEDDLGSSVSSYTDEVQLSRSMENGNFTCGLLIFSLYTLKQRYKFDYQIKIAIQIK